MEKATGSTTRQQVSRQQEDTLGSAAKRQRVYNSDKHTETDPLDDEMQETLLGDDPVIHDQLESEGSNSSSNANIDSNVCCVCFCTYKEDQEEETGFSWVKCVCQ